MILICGGAGYIGSHMVYEMIERGHEIVVVDNLSTGYQEAVHPSAKFYHCDIRDIVALDRVFKENKIDAVVHFAASSLVGESVKDPYKYYDNNVGGSRALLQVMENNGVKRIVFSSTAAVYGIPKAVPILETATTQPINPYGETKLAVERMLHWAEEAFGLKSVCLRYFNVAGAHVSGGIGEAHQPETHLLPLILQVPLGQRDFVSIFGNDYQTEDGTCIRDYIHVADLIDAHILALGHLEKTGKSGVYNLGNGNGFSVQQMVESVRKVTGHAVPARLEDRRGGDPDILVASSEKAKQELGWMPKHPDVEDIIRTAWNWHSGHPRGYTEIG